MSDASGAALLLVDVQHDFLAPSLGALAEGYEQRVARLLDIARSAQLPIVHVHSSFAEDGSDWMRRYRARGRIPCVAGTEGAVVVSAAAPAESEAVVVKQTFDPFVGTDLDARLRDAGVEVVLVAGLITSTCVLLTAAGAMQRGYLVGVVEDATADVPATHEQVLARYPFVFDVVATDGALDWVRRTLARSRSLGPMPRRP